VKLWVKTYQKSCRQWRVGLHVIQPPSMLAEEQHTVYDRLHRRWTATKSLHKLLQTKRFRPNHSSSHYDGARGESEVRLRETWLSEANDLRSRRSPRANKGFAWLTTSLLYSYFATGRHALRRLVPSFTDRNVHFQHQSEAAQLKEWKLAVLSNFTITRDASVCKKRFWVTTIGKTQKAFLYIRPAQPF